VVVFSEECRKYSMRELEEAIEEDDPECLARLIGPVGLGAIDERGFTLLQRSCFAQSPRCVRFLLEAGADPNTQVDDGYTALHIAAMSRAGDVAEEIRALLEHHADPGVRLRPGSVGGMVRDWTPLMLASAEGRARSVEILAGVGLGVDAVDRDGMTALMLAASQDYEAEDKVHALLTSGASAGLRSSGGWSALDYAVGHALHMSEGHTDPASRVWVSGIKQTIDGFLQASSRGQDKPDLDETLQNGHSGRLRVIELLRRGLPHGRRAPV